VAAVGVEGGGVSVSLSLSTKGGYVRVQVREHGNCLQAP